MAVPSGRAAAALVRSERRSSRPCGALVLAGNGGAARRARSKGRTRATIIGAQPNKRLKLTPPGF